jgi:hypothetical protein
MDKFQFAQLDETEMANLNRFANAHPHQAIQICLWMEMNMVMDQGAAERLCRYSEALAGVVRDDG